jgi:hypothetical protein
VLANPISGVNMIGVRFLSEPRSDGLLGREESLLRLSYFMEPSRSLFVRSQHCTNPQLYWGIMHHEYMVVVQRPDL